MKSYHSADAISAQFRRGTGDEYPRLKQFTHATRVPPPQSPSNTTSEQDTPSGKNRVASQTAQVYKGAQSHDSHLASADELYASMHYVHALGGRVCSHAPPVS